MYHINMQDERLVPKLREIVVISKHLACKDSLQAAATDPSLRFHFFSNLTQFEESTLHAEEIEYFFFPFYSEIIPEEFVEIHTCIGFHTGDLPNDRGGSPIQHKILLGEYLTNVSALRLSKTIDGGDIYLQQEIDLSEGNIVEVISKISDLITTMILRILKEAPTANKQAAGGTVRKRLTPSDSEFEISNLTLRQIYDRIRMLDGLDYEKANLVIGRHRIILSEAKLNKDSLSFHARIENKDNHD